MRTGVRAALFSIALANCLCTPFALAAETALYDFENRTQTLEQHVGGGRWTVVMFWASDCHVCNEEAAALSDFSERTAEHGIRLVGIGLDGLDRKAEAAAFLQRHSVTFPSLLTDLDTGAGIYNRLTGRRWIGTPTFLVFSPDGRVAAQQVGAVETDVIEAFVRDKGGTPN